LAESIDAVRAIVAASSFDREVLVVSGETGRGQQMIDEPTRLRATRTDGASARAR
jgi:hypothetical protein